MRESRDRKGKKRALPEVDNHDGDSSLSPPPPEPDLQKFKRSKKADTRVCPVCDDDIPVRLLAHHAEFELQRVEDIVRGVGSSNVVIDDTGPTSSRRGAALKARKSLSTLGPKGVDSLDTLERTEKTIKAIKRNRKQRHTKLREIMAPEDEHDLSGSVRRTSTCPVCMESVPGDEDFFEAHVDGCVAHASRLQAEADSREARSREEAMGVDAWDEVEVNGETRIRLVNSAGLRGTGFHVRDTNQQDVDIDIDVDGDDEVLYGDVQFTEGDVLPITAPEATQVADGESDGEGNTSGQTLRDFVATGNAARVQPPLEKTNGFESDTAADAFDTDQADQAIVKAKRTGNTSALVAALETKVKQLESVRISSTSQLCRICLDPYNEPTTSTGCWHTCCRECWLRCLGSTKLCPICKRITAAAELRRIYM